MNTIIQELKEKALEDVQVTPVIEELTDDPLYLSPDGVEDAEEEQLVWRATHTINGVEVMRRTVFSKTHKNGTEINFHKYRDVNGKDRRPSKDYPAVEIKGAIDVVRQLFLTRDVMGLCFSCLFSPMGHVSDLGGNVAERKDYKTVGLSLFKNGIHDYWVVELPDEFEVMGVNVIR